jgi:hypothetical protein
VTSSEPNKFNYDIIQKFNEKMYQNLLFPSNISGGEIFVKKAKNDTGEEFELNQFFYPLTKENVVYLLPSERLRELPIEIERSMKVGIQSKGYTLILACSPRGLGSEKTYPTFKEFINSFCDYGVSNPTHFTLWKIISIMSYISRLNLRVATNPAFGKDSIFKVLNSMIGDIGVVNNPSIAKIEWLLTNRVIVTNEVANVQAKEKHDLEQYYLTCGDFSNIYTKRSRASLEGSKESYDISKLSNIVVFNNIECYQESDKKRYFDYVFQKAIKERFFPLKMEGTIIENFSLVRTPEKFAEQYGDNYKKIIKYLKFLQKKYETELHHYIKTDYGFKDRALRNWETMTAGIDMYADTQEEYSLLCSELYKSHKDYLNMVKIPVIKFDKSGEPQTQLIIEEVQM